LRLEKIMRTDDFKNAIALSAKELALKEAKQVASLAGAELKGEAILLPFMNRPCQISLPSYQVAWADPKPGEEFSLTDAVLVLHYLQGANGQGPSGDLLSYRQIPGGEFYIQAFRRRAEIPLAQTFGTKPGLLTKAGALLGGEIKNGFGDEALLFRILPRIDIMLIIHLEDEEFEADGQVLFDSSVSGTISVEDASWLGSALVYRIMGLARGL
jgi:hypothetical protein